MIEPTSFTATESVDSPERAAAKQLEAFFLRQFLTEARPKNSLLTGGFAGETFQGMLDGALADAMAEAGGFGLVDTFESALGGDPSGAGLSAAMAAPSIGAAFDTAATTDPSVNDPTAVGSLDVMPSHPATGAMFQQPAQGRLSSGFGTRTDPVTHAEDFHPGLDIAAPIGAPVVAAAAGRVTHAGPAGTYGNLVTIQHANGTETRYAHMSVVRVERGDAVAAGARLGDVGSTGKSTGPHLHFEVRSDGRAQDPRPFLPGRAHRK